MKRLAHFFIDQPVFAAVLSLLIVLGGSVAIFSLPITEYPEITPPEVTVQTTLPGATAEVLEKTVAVPIEESVNGAKNIIYLSDRMANDGSYNLRCFFKAGSDPDTDAQEVQNRVLQAESTLPAYVVQNGIVVKKRTPTTLAIISLFSKDKTFDSLFLSNYEQIHLLDPLIRVKGVGTYELHGRTYAMRLWLEPDRMAALGVTAADVRDALTAQNNQIPPGDLGTSPAAPGTSEEYVVTANNELSTPEQYDDMVIRRGSNGSVLRLRDIGHAELGPRAAGTFTDVSGYPGASLQLYEAPGGNALKAVKDVRQQLGKLTRDIPPGVQVGVTLDTTLYIRESIKEVLKTLGIALVLVLVIVYLFLGTFRATLIPMLAVPVSLIGAVGTFALLGFSINLLSLFGLVLAIGLVVDDAIIVVEAVERHVEDGDDPKEAAKKAMDEVSRAILAIALVLSFVFIPIAFISGITGSFYRQFSLALASSLLISAFVAVSLTPAMCGAFLKPKKKDEKKKAPLAWLAWLTDKFKALFDKLAELHTKLLKRILPRWGWASVALGVVVGLIVLLAFNVPSGFIPAEDQGYFYITLSTPDGTSLQRTEEVSRVAEQRLKGMPGVRYINTLGGYTFLEDADQANATTYIVDLEPWGKRTGKGLDVKSLMKRSSSLLEDLPDVEVTPQEPASVPGLGGAGGFTFQLEDLRGGSTKKLADVAETLTREAAKRPELDSVYDTIRMAVPQVDIKVDRDRANALGVPVSSVFDSLQIQLGGLIVNNFNRFGRIYKTILQADERYRSNPDDIHAIYVRSNAGGMVPLSDLLTMQSAIGPNAVQRFNMYRSIEISGGAAKGYSSGQALAAMEKLAKKLPSDYGFEWSGIAYQEKQAQGRSAPIFALALVFVYLVLAAQFESWLTPLSVLLAIPTGALGVFLALKVTGLDDSVYAQIGLVTMIGLTAKNAILIVEFAQQSLDGGKNPQEAGMEGAKMRFRPILMTSLAFILGMLPLVFSSGAEAVSRRTLGATILGGMLATTLLTVFITPIFWVSIEGYSAKRKAKAEENNKGKESDKQSPQNDQDDQDKDRDRAKPSPEDEGNGPMPEGAHA